MADWLRLAYNNAYVTQLKNRKFGTAWSDPRVNSGPTGAKKPERFSLIEL